MIVHYIEEKNIFAVIVFRLLKVLETNYSDNFLHQYNVEIFYLFDQELQLINTDPLIKNKSKELLNEMKKFKVQIIFLDYQTRNDHKIFHSNAYLIASNSDIDKAFKSMDQNVMTKIKTYASEDYIVLDVTIKHSITIVECQYKEKKWE